MKLIRQILAPRSPNANCDDLAVSFLALVVGLSMAFGHGMGKIPPSEAMVNGLASMGFPQPLFFAWCAALAEVLGGICLAIGFLTRPAALFLMITMGVALFVVHAADPFQDKELALLYFAAAVFFFIYGGGRWSVDAVVSRLLQKRL